MTVAATSLAPAQAGGTPSRLRWLAAPSSSAWLRQALAHPDTVLIDHAHCERKAAGVALQPMFRYPSDAALAEVLSPLAREELDHFVRVLAPGTGAHAGFPPGGRPDRAPQPRVHGPAGRP